MSWRNLIKMGAEKKPLTKEMFANGEIKKGDYLTPTMDLPHTSGRIPFLEGKYYEVIRVTPKIIYLKGEFGEHGITFEREDGGAGWFALVTLSDDEKMGIFESVPGDILDLLLQYKTVNRRAIIDELLLKYYTKDKTQREDLKEAILQSLILLQRQDYIMSGATAGSYKITDKGMLFRKGKDFSHESPSPE